MKKTFLLTFLFAAILIGRSLIPVTHSDQISEDRRATPAIIPVASLRISGHIRYGNEGPGVPNVRICRSIANYPGELVAITNADGYYEAPPLITYGQRETVNLWAAHDGYAFEPPYFSWVYDGGYNSSVIRDFTAIGFASPPTITPTSSSVVDPAVDPASTRTFLPIGIEPATTPTPTATPTPTTTPVFNVCAHLVGQ